MTEQFSFNLMNNGSQLISRGQTEEKSAVPEPASLMLLGTALCAIGYLNRRREG